MSERTSVSSPAPSGKDSIKGKRKQTSSPNIKDEEDKVLRAKSDLVMASLASSGLGVVPKPTDADRTPPKGYCKFMYERDSYVKDESKPKVSRKTKRKVAATKYFLRQYYAELATYLARRALRQETVKAFLAEQDWPQDDKQSFMEQQYEKESSYLRLRRRRTALNDFAILALLGRGGYGEVYLCRKIDTGEVLALKRMKKSRFTEKNDVLRVMKEREVMVKSNSPWLARLKYCFQTETHLYMAMEYIPGGDVKNLLDHFGAASEDEARFYLAEMLLAVADLHALGYIHRDLKPDNFMIDKSGHLKLIDFGLSKDGWKSKYTKASFRLLGDGTEEALKPKKKKKNLLLRGWTATWSLFSRDKAADDAPPESARSDKPRIRKNWSVVGSPEYMAVEILSQEGYDHLCDFWSLGVILYEFVFGATPFGAPTALQVFNNIKNWQSRLNRPPSVDGEEYPVSPDYWDLITKLICAPENRLGKRGVDEIKQHPFFRGVDFEHIKDSNPPFIPNLADELDTSYFVGMDEDDDENDETTESIDALLDRALSKSKKQQNETTLSTIFSHKDSKKSKKLTEEQGSAAAGLIERKEGSDSNKVMFTASASKFDFAGFGYKHDELTGPSAVGPLKDFSALRQSNGSGTTPKTSPRGTLSSPSTPRAALEDREHSSREHGSTSAPVTPGSSSSAISKSPRDGSSSKVKKTPREDKSDSLIRSPSGSNIKSPLPTRSGSPGPPEHPHSPKNTPPESPRHNGSNEHDVSKKKGHKRQTSTTIIISPRLDVEPGQETTRIDDSFSHSTESSQNQIGGTLSKIKKRLSALRSKFKNSSPTGSSGDLSTDEHTSGRDSSRNSPIPHNTDTEDEDHHGRSLARKNSGGRSRSPSVDHSRHAITPSSTASPTSSAPSTGRARAGSVGFDNRHSIIESDVVKAQKRASEGRGNKTRAKIPRAESEAQTSATSSSSNSAKSSSGRTSSSSGSTVPAVSLTPEAQRWKDRILQKAAMASGASQSQEEEAARQLKFRERILAKASQQMQPTSPAGSAPGSPSASPPSSATVSPSPSFSGLVPSRGSKKSKKSPRPSDGERSPLSSPSETPTDLSPRDSKDEKRKSAGRKKRSNSHATRMVTSPIPVASLISLPGTPLENSPESSPRDGNSQPSSPRFIKTSVGKSKTSDKVVHASSSPHLPESPVEASGRPRRGTIASTTSPIDHLDVKESKKEKRRSEGRPKREKRARSDIPAIVEEPIAEQHVSPPHTSPKREDDRHDSSKSSPEGSSKHRIVIR